VKKNPSNDDLHEKLVDAYRRKEDIDLEITGGMDLVEKNPFSDQLPKSAWELCERLADAYGHKGDIHLEIVG
jgi:hypothetical protein